MSLTPKITRILVPTDFSPPSQVACCFAARLANYLKAGIVLFHAIPGMDLLEEIGRARGKTEIEVLNDLRSRLQSWFEAVIPAEFRGLVPVEATVVVGEPSPAIAPAAKRSGADLILMATHGRIGLAHLLMGSVTETVLRSIPVPVLALRVGQGDRPLTAVQRILWATDLSPVSEGSWRYALTLADVFAAEVILMHVVPPSDLPWLDEQPVPTPGSWLEQHVAPFDRTGAKTAGCRGAGPQCPPEDPGGGSGRGHCRGGSSRGRRPNRRGNPWAYRPPPRPPRERGRGGDPEGPLSGPRGES